MLSSWDDLRRGHSDHWDTAKSHEALDPCVAPSWPSGLESVTYSGNSAFPPPQTHYVAGDGLELLTLLFYLQSTGLEVEFT